MTADTSVRRGDTGAPHRARRLSVAGWVLRQQRRAIAGWSLALAIVCAIYVGFWPAMGGADLTGLIEGMPDALVQALGYEGIGTAPGYLDSTIYSMLAPALLLVFAIGSGARILAGQEEDGTLELELALPIDRRRVLLERFVALAVQVLLLAVVVLVVVASMVLTLDMEVAIGGIAAATLGLFLLALAMGTVSLGAGAATGRRTVAVAAGAGLAVASFMADVLAPLVEDGGWLERVSPFAWYLGGDPLLRGIDKAGFGGLLAITVVALAVALPVFARRDLGV